MGVHLMFSRLLLFPNSLKFWDFYTEGATALFPFLQHIVCPLAHSPAEEIQPARTPRIAYRLWSLAFTLIRLIIQVDCFEPSDLFKESLFNVPLKFIAAFGRFLSQTESSMVRDTPHFSKKSSTLAFGIGARVDWFIQWVNTLSLSPSRLKYFQVGLASSSAVVNLCCVLWLTVGLPCWPFFADKPRRNQYSESTCLRVSVPASAINLKQACTVFHTIPKYETWPMRLDEMPARCHIPTSLIRRQPLFKFEWMLR